jgi:hypothetical protein
MNSDDPRADGITWLVIVSLPVTGLGIWHGKPDFLPCSC